MTYIPQKIIALAGAQQMRAALRAYAAGAMGAFPQYDGRFADWELLEATRHVTFKGGTVLYAGDLVLGQECPYDPTTWTFFDVQRQHCCGVDKPALRPFVPMPASAVLESRNRIREKLELGVINVG